VQAYQKMIERGELLGVAALVVIGVALIALAPAKELVARTSADAVRLERAETNTYRPHNSPRRGPQASFSRLGPAAQSLKARLRKLLVIRQRRLTALPACALASRWHEARLSNRFGHCPHCGESVISSWLLAVRRTCNDTQGRPTPAFKFVALRR